MKSFSADFLLFDEVSLSEELDLDDEDDDEEDELDLEDPDDEEENMLDDEEPESDDESDRDRLRPFLRPCLLRRRRLLPDESFLYLSRSFLAFLLILRICSALCGWALNGKPDGGGGKMMSKSSGGM